MRDPTDLELRGAVQLLNAIEDRISNITPMHYCNLTKNFTKVGGCEICDAVHIIVDLQGQIHEERKNRK